MKTDTTFGAMLKKYREQAKLTLRDLGDEAGVPHSVISAIEAGRRSITSEVAMRLMTVLKVAEKDIFLLSAISTTKRQKILPFAKAYRAEVLNSMAIYLANAGVLAEDISECRFEAAPEDANFVTGVMERVKNRQPNPRFFKSGSSCLLGPRFIIATKKGQKYEVTVIGERVNKGAD